METDHVLIVVFLQFAALQFNQTEGIVTCDIEEKFIKVNETKKPDRRFQMYTKAFHVCAGVDNHGLVAGLSCDVNSPEQRWLWINKKQILNEATGKCLDVVGEIADWNKLQVKSCNSTTKSQQWACNGTSFLKVGETDKKMNYGNKYIPHIVLSSLNGPWNLWTTSPTTDSTLCSMNHYNNGSIFPKTILKIATVFLKPFCSIECAKEKGCKSFVFVKFQILDNCLLSSEPDDQYTIPYDGERFINIQKLQKCDNNYCQRGSTCLGRSSEPFFECLCPPWASGVFCEDLNPAYNLSSLPWRGFSAPNFINVDDCGHSLWATNENYRVYLFVNFTSTFVPNGVVKQISCGDVDNEIFALGTNNLVYKRIGINSVNLAGSKWVNIASDIIKQITSGSFGVLWAVIGQNTLVYRQGELWKGLGTEGYLWVSCGKYGCWAINRNGSASFRFGVTADNPGGVAWVDTGGSFKQLDVSVRGEVYAVDIAGKMYTREGIIEGRPEGYKWSKFGDKIFAHVSVGDNVLLGIDITKKLYALP